MEKIDSNNTSIAKCKVQKVMYLDQSAMSPAF